MKFGKLVCGLILCAALAQPATAEGWKSGYGQGATEAWVELGPGNRIHVSCTGGFPYAITGVEFTLASKSPPPNSTILLIVDDKDPIEVPIGEKQELSSNSRVEASWFETVRDALKTGETAYVRFPDGTGARFSLDGADKAIGDCPADFWRTDLID